MTEPQLDDSQLAAVDIVADTRQIVIAGPGSGKTEVVSALVEHLVDDEDIDPVDGLLVISFSNAAVHAADARLRARVGTRPVSVQTMDSLAAELLRELSTEEYEDRDFDRRIALATRLLRDEGWGRIDDVGHLIVDEVQDVVGVRAEFLLAIVEQLPAEAGFSLLGDPAQGIYDFQIRADRNERKPLSTMSSAELADAVASLPATEVRHLTGQYRARSRDTRAAAALRPAVLSGGDPRLLDDFHAAVVPAGTVEEVVDLAAHWTGRTAFLTATNGQALLVAGVLRNRTAVEVRRGARQRVIADWVARLLGDVPTDTVARNEFDKRVGEQRPELDSALLWRALRGVERGRGTEIDLLRLAQRLRGSRPLPPELMDQPATPVVVSTVHRAKGLEFDNVVLVDFPEHAWLKDATDPGEQLRARFVSLTRARRLLVRANGPDDRFVRLFRTRGLHAERWYLGGYKRWQTFAFEIGVADVEPFATSAAEAELQLTTQVSAGDPLELRLDRFESTLTVPVYTVSHNGIPVARTSRRFGEDLASRTGAVEHTRRSWPTLSGARVESVATVVVDPRPGSTRRNGFRLAPMVTGLLHLDWKESTKDD
ncbi:UvrD-helicase domain-containing protein [Kribbella sp. NPDC051952]|uniref:UvrD-helicase domain-containing protein n=1 Tax=Kribbella sp. NPDC051952 TaxID=3154851 RepID=UPI003429191F